MANETSPIRLLLIGPLPKPVTGNSLANQMVVSGFKARSGFKVKSINTSIPFFDDKVGKFSFRKFFNQLGFNFQAYKIFASDIVYITPGQSFLGVMKYSFLIYLSWILGKKIILHIHGNFLRRSLTESAAWKRGLMRSVLKRADAGIVLSDSLRPNLNPVMDDQHI